jgi:primosomal protein N' (replication factor Y)
MAVLASMPQLALIVVDEEHDPSYKQQEGARYSARDLALVRGQHSGAKVILGSATPSLESWHASTPVADGGAGRYQLHHGAPRGRNRRACRPAARAARGHGPPAQGTLIAPPLLAAIGERVARGEQALVLLNRRGWAPVLHCADCGWKSECPHCSAYRVFHKIDRTLRCHHCGLTERVPRACPDCGNLDIGTQGRGTEQLEEQSPPCWPTCAGLMARPRASPASTPTPPAARAGSNRPWPPCTAATWTCWWARR